MRVLVVIIMIIMMLMWNKTMISSGTDDDDDYYYNDSGHHHPNIRNSINFYLRTLWLYNGYVLIDTWTTAFKLLTLCRAPLFLFVYLRVSRVSPPIDQIIFILFMSEGPLSPKNNNYNKNPPCLYKFVQDYWYFFNWTKEREHLTDGRSLRHHHNNYYCYNYHFSYSNNTFKFCVLGLNIFFLSVCPLTLSHVLGVTATRYKGYNR